MHTHWDKRIRKDTLYCSIDNRSPKSGAAATEVVEVATEDDGKKSANIRTTTIRTNFSYSSTNQTNIIYLF